jgi:hypothetical protein
MCAGVESALELMVQTRIGSFTMDPQVRSVWRPSERHVRFS